MTVGFAADAGRPRCSWRRRSRSWSLSPWPWSVSWGWLRPGPRAGPLASGQGGCCRGDPTEHPQRLGPRFRPGVSCGRGRGRRRRPRSTTVELPVDCPSASRPVVIKATAVAARELGPPRARPASEPPTATARPTSARAGPACSFGWRAAEQGGATLVGLALSGLILMTGVLAVDIGALAAARAAAQTASDMAALAALTPGGRDAATRAAEIAQVNGAELVRCDCSAVQAVVRVRRRVRLVPGGLTVFVPARARAVLGRPAAASRATAPSADLLRAVDEDPANHLRGATGGRPARQRERCDGGGAVGGRRWRQGRGPRVQRQPRGLRWGLARCCCRGRLCRQPNYAGRWGRLRMFALWGLCCSRCSNDVQLRLQ